VCWNLAVYTTGDELDDAAIAKLLKLLPDLISNVMVVGMERLQAILETAIEDL
jgi:hypothetical protein